MAERRFIPDFIDLPVCLECGPVDAVRQLAGGRGIIIECRCGEDVLELPRRPRIRYDGRLYLLEEEGRRWRLRRKTDEEVLEECRARMKAEES